MPVLIPETSGRIDQHDRHLQALAEARNWKQVLAQIDKRLKKSKNNRLVINKALVQIRSSDSETQNAGCKLLESTLTSMAPILDDDVLEAVEDAASSLQHVSGIRTVATSMWEATLKARPHNEELLMTVFEHKVSAGDWDAARKLCMAKMKTDRDWFLRWIVCVQLISVSRRSKAPEMVKTMNAGLATKSLAKAVSDAVSNARNESTKVPGMQLMKSSKDVDLLVHVYVRHEKDEDLAKLLDELSESSLSPQVDGRFVYTREKVNALRRSKNWSALLDFSKALLAAAKSTSKSENSSELSTADDWNVWDGYITALLEVREKRLGELKEAVEVMKWYVQEKRSLNARLAHIALLLRDHSVGKELEANVVDLCGAYISDYGHKLFAFNHLKNCHLLDAERKKAFLQVYQSYAQNRKKDNPSSLRSAKDWLNAEINSLKQDYYHVVASKTYSESRTKLLRAFAANSLRLYRVSLVLASRKGDFEKEDEKEIEGPTERFMGDDAAIMAAMALIHLWFASDDRALLRCAFVLETLLSRSKYNYDAILLGIRVYVYMGQPARAAQLYKQLDAKHIQNLSAAWILIPRMSSLHPQQSRLWRDGPAALLKDGARWIRSSQGTLRRASVEAIRHASYGNFLRTIETYEHHHQSIQALTFASELDRISWIDGNTPGNVFSSIDLGSLRGIHDPREVDAFPNYENSGESSLEVALRPGPLPQITWIESQLRSRYFRYLAAGGPLQAADAAGISSLFAGTPTDESTSATDLTGPEVVEDNYILSIYSIMVVMLSTADRKEKISAELKESVLQLSRACDSRVSWLSSEAKERLGGIDLTKPSWYTLFRWDLFHWINQQFVLNSILLGTLRFLFLSTRMWKLDLADATNAVTESTKKFEKGAEEFRMVVKRWASSIQVELRQPEIIQNLVEATTDKDEQDPAAVEISRAGPEGAELADIREFSINVANGWADSLEAFTTQSRA